MSTITFSTKTARTNYSSKQVPFIPGGIHDNIFIKDIIVDKLPSGKFYIKFIYEDANGLQLQHTEFEPSRAPFHTDETFQSSVNNQLNRITNNQLYPYFGYVDGERMTEEWWEENGPQYDGTSFFGYINWIKEQIEDISKDVKVRIKAVYGKKGYVSLPDTSAYVSVEPMSSNKTLITKLKRDQFEPVVVDNEIAEEAIRQTKDLLDTAPSALDSVNINLLTTEIEADALQF